MLIESLNSTAIDVTKMLSHDVSDTSWAGYLKGDRGVFTGTAGHTYNALGVIYTNGTFAVPDNTRAPSSDELDCITMTPILISVPIATLTGQSLAAEIVGQSLAAILQEA